jgi:CheY-like chemotaxis protein
LFRLFGVRAVDWVADGLAHADLKLKLSLPEDKASLCRSMVRAGSLRVRVADTGAGLSKEQLAQVCQEGVQFNANELQAGQGSGLGLFITKGIVEQHGGAMSVTSDGLGRGSTFVVELPLFDSTDGGESVSSINSMISMNSKKGLAMIVDGSAETGVTTDGAQMEPSNGYGSYPDLEAQQLQQHHEMECVPGPPDAAAPPLMVPVLGVSPHAPPTPTHTTTPTPTPPTPAPAPAPTPFLATSTASAASVASVDGQQAPHPPTTGTLAAPDPDPARCRRVLVVDDAASNRKMLVRILSSRGFVCDQAEDGQQAVETYTAAISAAGSCLAAPVGEGASVGVGAPYVAIVMDYEMPVMNGPAAAKRLRELGCKVPIFGVTGNLLPEDVRYYKSKGANEVFGKPLSMSAFEEALKKFNCG